MHRQSVAGDFTFKATGISYSAAYKKLKNNKHFFLFDITFFCAI